jgi:hypothetical protein
MIVTKICKTCKQEKSIVEYQKDSTKFDGFRPYCKVCTSRRRKELLSKDTIRQRNLEKNFGKGALEVYTRLFEEQKGLCAICGSPENGKYKNLSIDHDHNTDQIRGLLCNNCNRGIGLLKDNPNNLRKAADYVENSLTLLKSGV